MSNVAFLEENRSIMAHFRIGILPLHIKTGIFRNTRTDDRVCLLCDFGEAKMNYIFYEFVAPILTRWDNG